jgi:hypothetical protein
VAGRARVWLRLAPRRGARCASAVSAMGVLFVGSGWDAEPGAVGLIRIGRIFWRVHLSLRAVVLSRLPIERPANSQRPQLAA